MLLENIEGKWKSVSVDAKCDECYALYKAKISTALRQVELIGHHQCRTCSSRRAGKKTAAKMSKIYSELYSGDGNPSKKEGVGKKISESLKGKKFSEIHKEALRKPKTKTEKFINAMQCGALKAQRSKRMIENNPVINLEVREKISNSLTDYYQLHGNRVFYKRFKTGWIENSKTINPIWCRSGLEIRFLETINDCDYVDSIETAENIRIKYLFEGVNHNYLPDFKLTFNDKQSMIVEMKSTYFASLPNWDSKLKALDEFCRKVSIGYLILNEKEESKWLELLLESKQQLALKLGI